MGGSVERLLNGLQDPKNQESIDNFVDFIVDQAPLILGGILALFTYAGTLIGVTASILGLVKEKYSS